ncbi:MAG: YebC/PmpR family DNA-binding transcriptional regulator [Clostridia bacterium]|nr:YebC/PmpR family DNA-binding transcriptional regulator [Oscillospiraceae bacterium]MBR4892436.1 YebC/PmpR family DNA-binding transcriptional regulator [Clostridia bacterium]
MSGHSKWSNIKHKKEKTDAQKAKIYTKLGREIAVAVKAGGPDPSVNGKLKDIIAKARANNMPNDNVKRCIEKAAGSQDTDNYEDIVYEGYGPKGVAVIVEALTDNRNRTAADVRHYFDKFGGNLGTNGCVSFMFDKLGVLIVEKNDSVSEEELMDAAMEAGASDFNEEDEVFEIITQPEDFSSVREELENKGFEFLKAEVTLVPQTYVSLTDEKDLLMMEKLIEHLEDNDDVQNIYHNWEE